MFAFDFLMVSKFSKTSAKHVALYNVNGLKKFKLNAFLLTMIFLSVINAGIKKYLECLITSERRHLVEE